MQYNTQIFKVPREVVSESLLRLRDDYIGKGAACKRALEGAEGAGFPSSAEEALLDLKSKIAFYETRAKEYTIMHTYLDDQEYFMLNSLDMARYGLFE